MPLSERTIVLSEARDGLYEEMEAKATQQAEYPMNSNAALQAAQEGRQAERFHSGVSWAIEEWGGDTEVVFAALTHGERNLARSIADKIGHDGAETNAWVALGTTDAPYLQHDPEMVPENESEVIQTVAEIPGLHPAFVDWAEHEISRLGRVDGDMGKSYRSLVLEKRARETSMGTNG